MKIKTGLLIVLCPFSMLAADLRLGAPDWTPSPEHPVGWRGDWTGCYRGATPPMVWGRRLKGITNGMRYQAAKPAGEPGNDAKPLEYFLIKEWLVAGPFAAEGGDPAKGNETDFLGGEPTVMPDVRSKAGATNWMPWRITMDNQTTHIHNEGICGNLAVDFVSAFGTFTRTTAKESWQGLQSKVEGVFDGQVAYAHTYLYAQAGGTGVLRMAISGSASKIWLNGKPVDTKPEDWSKACAIANVDLVKGWNRLLVKVASPATNTAGGPHGLSSKWRLAAYLMPPAPYRYESSGIAWMTRLTGRSMSNPIVLGDRIFVGSNITDLMCIDKADGKVIWIRSNTPWDALSAEERAPFAATIEPLARELDRLNAELPALINAQVSATGMTSDQQAAMDKTLKAKEDAEQKLHQALATLDRKRFPPMHGNEVSASNATPLTDGKRIYWVCGGGMKGPGASVISCFDPDGKRIWSYHEAFGAPEHGLHDSLLLVDGKVVAGMHRWLVAFDPANGAILWRQKCEEFGGASPVAVKVGGEWAILNKNRLGLHRASDGTRLAGNGAGTFGDSTPIVVDDVVYVCDEFKTWGDNNVAFLALKAPTNGPADGKWNSLYELRWEDTYVPARGISYYVASPLHDAGLVYTLDMSGGLAAIDITEQKGVYRRWLDGYCRFNRYLYGAVASPTLAGKGIYFVDDSGYTIIVKPGREYQELGRNVIENVQLSGRGGNPCHQESFYSNPVFDGKFLFLKGEEYLYAIRKED